MNKKKILLILVFVVVIGGVVGYLQYNKPHKDYEKASIDLSIKASQLLLAFEDDEALANQKYLDKMIEVNGSPVSVVTNKNGSVTIALLDEMLGVSCTFDSMYVSTHLNAFTEAKNLKSINIKGRCDGFLTDVKLSKCSFTSNE